MAAAFVLAVGVTGAVASFAVSIRTRHDAALAARAAWLAQALGERMRANRAAQAGGDAANPYLQLDYPGAGAAQAPPSCHGGAHCDALQLAAFDIHETVQALVAHFPSGRIRVCRDALGWNAGAGTLSWDCAGGPGAPVVVKIGWLQRGVRGTAGSAPRIAMLVPEAQP